MTTRRALSDGANGPAETGVTTTRRWVCRCSVPPVLLANVEAGQVNLKIRDRYYHIEGVRGHVRATCHRCGKQHVLVLGGATDAGNEGERGGLEVADQSP